MADHDIRENLRNIIIKIISTLNIRETTVDSLITKNTDETFSLKDILFILYLMEKCNIIRRKIKTYPFYDEIPKELFREISYIYYQTDKNWVHIKNEPRLNQLLDVILPYYQGNSIIKA